MPLNYSRYVEPFAGSACLFFELRPKEAILGDINQELIDTYVEVRDRVEDVCREMKKLRKGEKAYYQTRATDPSGLTPARRAARFIYLNRFCFNGLYRTNRQGVFNVPFGGERSGQMPSPSTLENCANILRHARLVAATFDETLELIKDGDFVYLDPPYCIKSRRVFNEYSNASFGAEQLKQLRSHLKRIDKMGVPFLVSYGHSREALELGRGFRCAQAVVQRQIAGFVANRRNARELIITNY